LKGYVKARDLEKALAINRYSALTRHSSQSFFSFLRNQQWKNHHTS